MIKPSNINSEAHTADFKCDEHGGSVVGLNLNTDTDYSNDDSTIIIQGGKLTESCGCTTFFSIPGGNQDTQDLAQAKTA